MTELSTEELAHLIGESVGRTPVSCEFGYGGTRLKRNKDGEIETAWAVPILEELRGMTFNAGSGI